MISDRGDPLAVGLREQQLEVLAEPAAILHAGQLVGRGQFGQQRVLAGELVVHGQDPLGDLEADGQLIGVGRLGQEVVGAGASPSSRSSRRSSEVRRMM